MFAMKFTTLVTLAALVYTFFLMSQVGRERARSGLSAPAVTGDEGFERAFRAHYNTIEQLVLFIPLLWLATSVVGDMWSAAVGAFWVLGRILYSTAYMSDPKKRAPGMIMTVASTAVLALVVAWGLIQSFI